MLSFNAIPVGIRTPGQYIEFDHTRAVQGLPALRQRILVIGQRLATGTVAAHVPTRVFSAGEAEAAFGRGSMLAGMVAALKAANRYIETFAIGVDDDAAGVAAAGKFTFAGTATAAGTLNLYLGGVRVRVGITAGMTADQAATAAAAAINAVTTLPATAAANLADCAITFRHKGEAGNSYDLRANYGFGEATPAGLPVTVTVMAGGTANPVLDGVVAAIGDDQYHTVVLPFTDAASLTSIETELERRWGPMVQREGVAFAAAAGTVAALTTLGDTRNSKHVSIMGAGKSPTPPWIWAAVTGVIDSAEPHPARPRQTLALPGCLAPVESDRQTREERDTLLHEGISTYDVDAAGIVRIERLITTRQVDLNGDPDPAYLDICTPRTVAYLRFSLRGRVADKFPRHMLADDGTPVGPGQAVATPSLIRAELLHLGREWVAGLLIENFEQFKRELVVERNASDRTRVDALIPPDLVNQLRVFAAAVQFII